MIEVPFDLVNDHVFVRASVNGLPLKWSSTPRTPAAATARRP